MIETREQVIDAYELQREWLKTCERFGSLVKTETLNLVLFIFLAIGCLYFSLSLMTSGNC